MDKRNCGIRRASDNDGCVVDVVVARRGQPTTWKIIVTLLLATALLNCQVVPVSSSETKQPMLRRFLMESISGLEGLLQQYGSAPANQDKYNKYEDERKRPSDIRIVGGTPAAAGTYPFYVNSLQPILCGGTLIYEDIVLTAAHCGGGFLAGAAIGGTQLQGTDATFVQVDLEFPHPNYSKETRVNDIMLVKLTDPSTAPIVTLNMNAAVPAANDVVTVIGFGDTSDGGDVSQILLQVDVNTYSDQFCDDLYMVFEPATMVCAGTAEGGRDSCQGDSGGPLFTSSLVQIGIVSTGSGCGEPDVPAIYTEVAAFESFIRQGICDLSDNPPTSCNAPTASPTAATVTPTGLTTAPVATSFPSFDVLPSGPPLAPVGPGIAPTGAPVKSPTAPIFPPTAPITPVRTPAPVAPPVKPLPTSNPTTADTPLPTVTGEPTPTFSPTFEPTSKVVNGGMMMMKSGKKGKMAKKEGKGAMIKGKIKVKKGPTLVNGNVIFTNDRQGTPPVNHLLRHGWNNYGQGFR